MPTGKGRGKLNYSDLRKDENIVAGPKGSFVVNTPEQAMDEYLKKLNLFRKPVAKDGSCLFRVVSEQVFKTQAYHQRVRKDCIKFMQDNKNIFESFIEGSFEHYLFSLRNLKEWGGHSEISALSLLYKYDFIIYQLANPLPQDVTGNSFDKKIHLCYLNNNHYDSVYPVSFKVNAAFMQSILYELLLDNVFAEADRREIERSKSTGSFVEETPTSGWTEVKNKQTKGKPPDSAKITADNMWDSILVSIPEASKNPKVNRSLKASLDPSTYRNVDLEVWENSRNEQQRCDHALAASYQYKPGDLCYATIHESKDVSTTIRVKIYKFAADTKCIVHSENMENQYYVQLDDLRPIMNGESDYKSLPGYYNKYENEQEFQSQKRRGKHARKIRDDDRVKNDPSNFQNNDQNNRLRMDKDSRNNRRGIRNSGKDKKDENQKPTTTTIKTKENKKPDKSGEVVTTESVTTSTNSNTNGVPPKVAKPAETAAAFWGRMRNKPPNDDDTPFEQSATSEDSNNSQQASQQQQTSITKKQESYEKPFTDKKTDSSSSIASKTTPLSTATKVVTSSSAISTPVTTLTTPTTAHKPLFTSECVTTASKVLPMSSDVAKFTSYTTSQTRSSPIMTSSIEQDTRKFNLTTQASAKLNEVRENLILSTAKMEELTVLDIVSAQPSIINDDNKLQPSLSNNVQLKVEEDALTKSEEPDPRDSQEENSPIVEVTEIHLTTPEPNEKTQVEIVDDAPITATLKDNISMPPKASTPIIKTIEVSTSSDASIAELPNDSFESQQRSKPLIKVGREKIKKKVSFGCTTEIVEKISPMLLPHTSAVDTNMRVISSVEPGKIHLPPEHIEKHLNNFSGNTTTHYQEVTPQQLEQQSSQQQTRLIQQQQQQQQQFLQAAGIPFYHHQPSHVSPVMPMFYRGNIGTDPRGMPQLSQDPEGKDLPEDMTVLQYYYNIGVQYVYAQNVHQMNQAGILPLPVVTPLQTMQARPFVINTDTSQGAGELLNHNTRGAEGAAIEMQQQPPNILQPRFQTPHINFHHPHIHQTGAFEEYETPPRLRRSVPIPTSAVSVAMGGTPITPTNHRANLLHHITQPQMQQQHQLHHRQILNGRGIMGQGPKSHRIDHIRIQSGYPM